MLSKIPTLWIDVCPCWETLNVIFFSLFYDHDLYVDLLGLDLSRGQLLLSECIEYKLYFLCDNHVMGLTTIKK